MATKALRFHAVVRGKALPLPDLSAFEGKRVEVIVRADEEDEAANAAAPASVAAPRPGEPRRRIFGGLRGKVTIHGDFDAPLPDDIQKYFEGRGDEVEEGK
jgi:hypothetical protein